MNIKTKHKVIEENMFADMVVLAGIYMEYIGTFTNFNAEDFIN